MTGYGTLKHCLLGNIYIQQCIDVQGVKKEMSFQTTSLSSFSLVKH